MVAPNGDMKHVAEPTDCADWNVEDENVECKGQEEAKSEADDTITPAPKLSTLIISTLHFQFRALHQLAHSLLRRCRHRLLRHYGARLIHGGNGALLNRQQYDCRTPDPEK